MSPLEAEVDDWRALSLFEKRPAERAEVIGGIATASATLLLVPAVLALATWVSGAIGSRPAAVPAQLEVVETRFVKLGRPLDPKRLPDRDVPVAQPEAASPTTTEEAQAPEAKNVKPAASPTDDDNAPATNDLLNELSKSAGAIAEDSRAGTETEGHEDGIAEGEELEDLQNLYLGKLYSFFRRGWQVPTSISDAVLERLSCVVEVEITENAEVSSFRIVRPSGNDPFDQSVNTRMAQTVDATLPPPPNNVAGEFLGQTISLRFFGRHAR